VTDFQQCAWRSPEGHCCLLAAGHDDEHQTFFEVPLRGAPATRPQDVPSPAVTDAVKPYTRDEVEELFGTKGDFQVSCRIPLRVERLLATAKAGMENKVCGQRSTVSSWPCGLEAGHSGNHQNGFAVWPR
jgi:hypothetical protein